MVEYAILNKTIEEWLSVGFFADDLVYLCLGFIMSVILIVLLVKIIRILNKIKERIK